MTVKIENRTKDDIILTSPLGETEIPEEEDLILDTDGDFTLSVKRKRIPDMVTAAKKKLPIFEEDATPASHVQLKTDFSFSCPEGDATVTLKADISIADTLHEDAMFVGYKAEAKGVRLLNEKSTFSSPAIKDEFMKKQISGAVFPVGAVGGVVLLLGIFCLIMNFGGQPVNFLGNIITLPYAALISGAGVLVTGLFISNIIKILKRVKAYS